MEIVFKAVDEDEPGPKWRCLFDRHWHGYSRWFMREGIRARPTYLASLKAVRAHLPELLPAYEKLVTVSGGGDLEARFLSMWCPPAYIGGCSQAIVGTAAQCLIRNYDYGPRLLEGTWLASRLCGRRVVAMVDSLWGVLDGINESGLALSLSFGGRPIAGQGFGIPIVLRYALEIASTTAEAIEVLKRVPVNMSYTIAILDRGGKHSTVFVNPDRPTEVVDSRVSTNHQHRVEWKRHAEATRSIERGRVLERATKKNADRKAMLDCFMRPPVRQTSYEAGYGTLYTALYTPEDCGVELIWPAQRWRQTCSEFQEGTRKVRFV